MKLKIILSSVLMGGAVCTFGQKKPLDHSVYDAWQSVGSRQISNDGKWIGYNVDPQEGDTRLYLTSPKSSHNLQFSRGTKLTFTSDSKFALFSIKPFFKDIKAVKDKKLKKDKLTKDTLGVVNLMTQKIEKIPNVQSFKSPEKGGAWMAYLLENMKDKTAAPDAKDDEEAKGDDDKNAKPSDLILVNLLTGKKTTYENVIRYQFSENGKQLIFVTQKPEDKKEKKDEKKDKSKPVKYALQTVNWVDVEKGTLNKIAEAEGEFSHLTFDKQGDHLAFVGTSSAKNDLVKDYQLYYFSQGAKNAVLNNQHSGLPKGWVISENRAPVFSKNGKQLYFGIAPKPIAKDTTLIANDHAVVDVWNYKDDYLQTVQLKNLGGDLKKSYGVVLQTEKPDVFNVLGGEAADTIRLVNEGNAPYVLASYNKDSRIQTQWDSSDRKNFYLINNITGNRTEIVKDLNGNAVASPLGKYVVYFDRENGNWYSYNVSTKTTTQLNKNINVKFTDEEFDMPDKPVSYGLASWTDNDESVIIKDRYDLWEFFLDGKKAARNITNGYGRIHKISFNTYYLDKDIKSLNRKQKMYISAFNNDTKEDGIYETSVTSGKDPKQVYMGNVWGFRTLVKAKNANEYIFTKESYINSPNLFATSDFKDQLQLSNINPQQAQYNWGTDELVQWTTPKGYKSTGVLYKPENFDPNKKYPMIVYFYEKLSDNLNRYVAPAPTPSRLNISYFVSNGYLVFTPDISYNENGHPGRYAIEYINSGVEHLKKNSWVDGQHIGIQGQSWGGYQVAYLITQTNMYAAAWAGAPVANMTSAYGGIRWGSGMNRQFQYEKTQSRIGKTLWEARDLYIENSPLFYFDKVSTPVVIMHNDKDGAVPWYQGIEMFTGLRRLGKPVWMLNYNGDDHNLIKRQNRKDIQIREQQFFDYYLKGAKAPVWMTKGVPATMKGKDWGFDLTDEKP
ncbi:prolyl oligopeptidase family serine peptidase [Elizabethkingia meningoseptica]|uniref:alpha/beta hydrolase family protein n=1 Tax=Elizabethkingia meningoseptica TaxID=238 RepID=UPI0023B0E249|nr:prolyl oligopeptidase family serine peptidase [Elizabethkingia meningoseptica]MDE5436584.1 prolyl oligopeptidase family serine peptidase [Elizabethkingia meningoseptica]MDE5508216.1 prolyl oligopeptidase family serine peptidase [Elizabethkingia meningoseptica]MDE5514906.1 prolyl oligopeptidase family serine peptidase [Elizabethkingia meningoseptica]MDE5525594.1 prolyl oligopeptidase family serine peptidase [Elizabethkingia meningoseptica]MDE5529172.1 prolyl oligopeptidase family serine pept